MQTVKRLSLPAQIDQWNTVLDFLQTSLRAVGCPEDTCTLIAIAAEEVFVNIVHYAYGQQSGEVDIRLSLYASSRRMQLRFADSGIPYNPLDRPDPDITLGADRRAIGGLGIYMAKRNMDEVSYKRENHRNVLTMLKHF